MTDNNPWAEIQPPSHDGLLNARRVDPDLRWDFFWARSTDGTPQLLLEHGGHVPLPRVPKAKGLSVTHQTLSSGRDLLALQLTDSRLQDVFHQLCLDVVGATRAASDEESAVEIAVNRTWRWHRLLKGGGDGPLTLEEQKGLIGELVTLERLLDNMRAFAAVTAWRGPLGAPKDFEVGRVAIEAKARRGAATPHVLISSADQLDPLGVDQLFLAVIDLAESADEIGVTLTEIADRLRDLISRKDEGAADLFEGLLISSGYRRADDYGSVKWLVGELRVFNVDGDFPRISASSIPVGISQVRYALDLNALSEYQVTWDVVDGAIRGEENA